MGGFFVSTGRSVSLRPHMPKRPLPKKYTLQHDSIAYSSCFASETLAYARTKRDHRLLAGRAASSSTKLLGINLVHFLFL